MTVPPKDLTRFEKAEAKRERRRLRNMALAGKGLTLTAGTWLVEGKLIMVACGRRGGKARKK